MCDCKEGIKMKQYFIMALLVILYIVVLFADFQPPIYVDSYDEALLYCSSLDNMDSRNSCRAQATRQFHNLGEHHGKTKKG